jgi:branched-chain amino acid transport system substrate-binding protein
MVPILTHIADGQPELIYLPVFLPAGGFIVSQAKEVPGLAQVQLMGADGLFSPDMVDAAGGALEGFYVSSPLVSGPEYEAFVAKYREAFGREPISAYHAHAYDAAKMIFAAIEKVAVEESNGTLHIPRSALREIMYATQGFHGLTGMLTCSPTGDCADPLIAVYQYHTGRFPPEKIWP